MGTWGYRIVYHDCDYNEGYYIHEIHYGKDGEILGFTDPVLPWGNSEEELLDDLRMMISDAAKYSPLSLKELREL